MGKEKSKKRRYSSSSSHSSSSSGSSRERRKIKKLKKKLKKEQKKAKKMLKRNLKLEKKNMKSQSRSRSNSSMTKDKDIEPAVPSDVPIKLMDKSKSMAPITKEEWEKKQSVVKRVLDEETGRYRLIKGDGEVLEEIVSKDRHKEINRQATKADGAFFQSQTVNNRK